MAERQKKEQKQTVGDWLYFCPKEIGVRDLYQVVAADYEAEIWEEAGVVEIVLGEKNSIDIEAASIHPKDEITGAFAKEQNAVCVFLATFMPEDYVQAEVIMRKILSQYGGIFCGDTDDFKPQVK